MPSAGNGSAPCGPWWWQWGREKAEQKPPLPIGYVLLTCPPVTAPSEEMCDHGVSICPPWQPSYEAQKQTSCAESGTAMAPLVAMHMRSEAADAPAKAQQQPHMDWSRMSPMMLAHLGQLVSLSKESGMAAVGVVWLARGSAWTLPQESGVTPQSDLTCESGFSSKRTFLPAFQRRPGLELIWAG